jgi:ribonuclease BN (tRNA processing enzyme)
MRFTVLGSGTALPDGERGSAGFAVQHADKSWWVDGGSGTLQRSARFGIDPLTLSGGVYSHHHPDHCADLLPLLFAFRVARRMAPYPIWAGQGFDAFLSAALAPWGKWVRPPGEVCVHELPLDGKAQRNLGGVLLETVPANHTASALHLSFEAGGRRVVFSGDTGWSDALVSLSEGADLLVCECAATQAHPSAAHLRPDEVAAVVDAARPTEVWLTHFYPGSDPAEAVRLVAKTGASVRRAHDGDTWGD